MTPAELVATWMAEAEVLRKCGAGEAAKTTETRARELEAALQAREAEALTLREAAEESGYSQRRLRELVAEGEIPNAGRKGRPRILRVDLPRRTGRSSRDGFDASAEARAILSSACAEMVLT